MLRMGADASDLSYDSFLVRLRVAPVASRAACKEIIPRPVLEAVSPHGNDPEHPSKIRSIRDKAVEVFLPDRRQLKRG